MAPGLRILEGQNMKVIDSIYNHRCAFMQMEGGEPLCIAPPTENQHPCYYELEGAFCTWFVPMETYL
jgi:hypothetical protein